MSSLYRRANPSQARILRIVEGAVKNAADAHSDIQISPHHRRSIAKRAAGTLTAQWPEVLAAKATSLSEIGGLSTTQRASRQSPQLSRTVGRGASHSRRRAPLGQLRSQLAYQMKAIKAAGQTERAQAFIDVLRMIAALDGQP